MSEFINRAQRYHEAISKALLKEWDPIGVSSFEGAQDEYDAYVGEIHRMLSQRASAKELFDYLWWLETQHMGLRGDRQRTEAFANRLLKIIDEVESSTSSQSS